MKTLYWFFLSMVLSSPLARSQNTDIDSFAFLPVVDSFWGTPIVDQYRFFENLNSRQTQDWVDNQCKISQKYLRNLKGTASAHIDIEAYGQTDFELPRRQGKYYFSFRYSNENRTSGLYYQKILYGNPELLVNPAEISKKDQIVLGKFKLSKDSRYLAYQFHRGGSDWAEIKVVGMNGKQFDDHLKQLKFSDIFWQGNGFYYSKYRVSDSLANLTNEEIYFHTLGEQQEADKIVFGRPLRPKARIDITVTSDERFCLIEEADSANGILDYYIKDAFDPDSTLRTFIRRPAHALTFLDSHDGYLFALTKQDANGRNLVKIRPEDPLDWKTVLPKVEGGILLNALILDKYIAVVYQLGLHQSLVFFNYQGEVMHLIKLDDHNVFGDFRVNKYDKDLIYYFYSYLLPPVVYRLNLETFERTAIQVTGVKYDLADFGKREIEYASKDGTNVSMTLLFKKGLKLNGKNPTLLSAYGGFGIISQPHFQPGLVYFLSKGGVYAFAKIRGGGEKGESWHRAGSGKNKQVAFDDFIAAAEYLIHENYTAPSHLAITGTSHGGLVVGAAITQRPELFKAAIPVVGVFDMLRFERFTVGNFHTGEFGTVQTLVGFKQLLAYSPLHNIKSGINYPATLIVTAENDDRVPPFHSFKFAAALQNNPGQTNPVLLLVQQKAGHGLASTFKARVAYEADFYSFVLYHTKD